MEIPAELKNEITFDKISKLLTEGPLSITELSKRANITRTTLIYYLNKMEAKGMIERQRIESGTDATGRPTMISLKKELVQENREKVKHQEDMNQEILEFLSESPKTMEDIKKLFPDETDAKIHATIIGLNTYKHIDETYSISLKGRAYLEELRKLTHNP